MLSTTADLDTEGTLGRLQSLVRLRRQVEVDDLELVLHYCDLHSAIPAERGPGGEQLGDLGGDGTPGVAELALVELGVARQVHTHSVRSAVADALDLRHRLPHVWALVRDLRAEVWVARKVASMSRRLSYEQVQVVDRAVADAISGQSPARVLDLAAAKVIEADRAAHDARVEEERRKRYVGATRPDDTGLQTVYGRITAGDASGLLGTVQQVADALGKRPEHSGLSADELRAEAFAWLARPDDVQALLAGAADPRQHRQRIALFVHLHQAAIDAGAGVGRVEGLGPHTLAQLHRLLGHSHITVKPVVDLNGRVSVDAYEHPETIKERVHLRWGGDAFPHATSTSRNVDYDHPVPYDPAGPRGQTDSLTSQPLSRTPHRAKTHLGYRCRPSPTGEMLWRTPHGLHRLVDHTGTHVIDETEYAAWHSDDPLDRALTRIWHQHRTGQLDRHDASAKDRTEGFVGPKINRS